MEFKHVSVLLDECIEGLAIKPDGIYCDGTAGGAGHSREIARRLDGAKGGKLVAIDRDPDAIEVAKQRLEGLPAQVVRGNYSQIDEILGDLGIDSVDGILLDLGVSSFQLDNAERGFSYHTDAQLDMRMSREGMSAKDVVNTYSAEHLSKIIFEYGEEKYANSIARAIVAQREQKPITTTLELAEIVKANVPQKVRRDGHPARKTFQAIRIAVNDELTVLEKGLDDAFSMLSKGGRLAVITFHSLEDRIVKQKMAGWCQGCTCPKDFPVCVCGNKPKARLVNRKPVCANETELTQNPRARSAKLRICEKI